MVSEWVLGVGAGALTNEVWIRAAGAVVVSTPQSVALLDTRKGIALFKKLNIPVRPDLHHTPPSPVYPTNY